MRAMELPKCCCGNTITTRQRVYCSPKCWIRHRDQAVERLFWSRVNKTDTCWLWEGPVGPHGYGMTGRQQLAHRRMWAMVNGPIPKGKLIMHSCDTPLCIRPEHLSLGTDLLNMRDAKAKGRLPRGHYRVTNPHLTPDQVREIRSRAAAGELQRELAKAFGIAKDGVSAIVTRKRWREVA